MSEKEFEEFIRRAGKAIHDQILKTAEEVTEGLPPDERKEMIEKLTKYAPIYIGDEKEG
jgi:hypothetical protein